jgi:HEAT repeat protein
MEGVMRIPSPIVAAWIAALFATAAPASAQDPGRVREFVDILSSDSAFEREAAEQALLKMGPSILPILERQAREIRDLEAGARIAQIRARLQAESETLLLARSVSKDLGRDSAFLGKVSSSDPESVLSALGQIAGYTAVLRNGAVVFSSAPQRYSANRNDLAVLLREVFRKDSGRDPRWIPPLATALRMVQDYKVADLLGAIDPFLRSPHAPIRDLAANAAAATAGSLGKEEREAWVARFGALLNDASPEVRASAASALLSLGSKEQLPLLLRHRKDPSEEVRMRLVDAVVSWEAPERAALLVDMTRDESSRVRRQAVAAVGALKADAFLPKLGHLLQDPDEYVRLEYMNVIRRMEHRGSVDIAARALRDGCTFVRARALEILDMLEASQHAAAVGALIDDYEFESIRLHAVRLLGRWKAFAHVPAILRLLKDPKPSVRSAAVESLRAMGAREAAPQLAALAEDPSPSLRIGAARALIEWNEEPAAVERLLESSDESVSFAVACLYAEAGRREGAERLLRAAAGSNADRRAEALYALNALEAPTLYARAAELRLDDRRFDGSGLQEILSFAAQQASLGLALETAGDRKFEVRTVGATGRLSTLLTHLMRRGEGEFAILLDEPAGRLRAMPLASALEHWKGILGPR